MLDAYQVEVIGATRDGGVYHATFDCIGQEYAQAEDALDDDDGYIPDNRRLWELLGQLGIEPLIRYSIDEWEGSNWEDLPYHEVPGLEDVDWSTLSDWGDEANVDYQAETVKGADGPVDVSMFVGVFCDTCGNRIE